MPVTSRKLLVAAALTALTLPAAALAQTYYGAYGSQPYCREYIRTITVGGRAQQGYGTACQQQDGSWQITNETAPQTVAPTPAYTYNPAAYMPEPEPAYIYPTNRYLTAYEPAPTYYQPIYQPVYQSVPIVQETYYPSYGSGFSFGINIGDRGDYHHGGRWH